MASSISLVCSWFIFFFVTVLVRVHAEGGFSVDIIRRDSPQSPYYDPSLTPADRVRAAVHRSLVRARYLSASKLSAAGGLKSSFQSEVIPNSFEYLMTLQIGTPPFKVVAIADTGSDLTWVQCKPCIECYKQISPIFDPSGSTTFGEISCETSSCQELPSSGCGKNSVCQYHYSYGDGSYTIGSLANDTFTFASDEGRKGASLPNILFGCSHESNGTFDKNGAGLVGLGGGPLSLVSQLSPSIDGKFSYCFVPYGENATSTLKFGFNSVFNGSDVVTTPLSSDSHGTFYYLQLEEITVGNDDTAPVKLSSPAADRESLEGNIIIDSGTTITFLPSDVMISLENSLAKQIRLRRTQDPRGFFNLCFEYEEGAMSGDAFPHITFKFHGAPLVLQSLQTFVKVSDSVICLAMVSSDSAIGIPIFGNIAQQNFHVGYDLKNKKLSFAPAECAKI